MVLKRKLPSRQNTDAADTAAKTSTPTDLSNTDFSAEPTKNTTPDQNSGNKDTDSFTADALKEAAAAMAKEMSDSRPKNDLYLDDPFSDISPTNHTPKSQTPPSQTAPEKPMADVFADLDDIPAAKPQEPKVEVPTEAPKIDTPPEPEVTAAPAPKEEKKETAPAAKTATDIDLSTPKKMKRNKRNKRTRGAAIATEAQAAPTDTKQSLPEAAAATATFAAKKGAASTEAAATDTPDMELAAHNKKDDATAKAEVERAIKEMSGAVPDPAEQEIEAAYLNPAEVNPEFLASAPKPDVSKLLAAETEPTETPETKAEETPKADITPEDASSFDLPTSFADTQEPKVTDSDAAASIETPNATPFPEPDVAPKAE